MYDSNFPRAFFNFMLIFKVINCGPVNWIDSDTKSKLANEDCNDGSVSNDVLINRANYVPFYKSKYRFGHREFDSPYQQSETENFNKKEFEKNGKFAVPWLEFSKETGSDILEEAKNVQYDINEEQVSRHNHNLNHKPDFHQGLWFHHHHHHNHNPDCFPFGNHRRPRPPPPPPSSTTAASIDPRARTTVGFINTKRPHVSTSPSTPLLSISTEDGAGIDIRLASTADDDEAERIVFPDD